jgi:hypothetical protein
MTVWFPNAGGLLARATIRIFHDVGLFLVPNLNGMGSCHFPRNWMVSRLETRVQIISEVRRLLRQRAEAMKLQSRLSKPLEAA